MFYEESPSPSIRETEDECMYTSSSSVLAEESSPAQSTMSTVLIYALLDGRLRDEAPGIG